MTDPLRMIEEAVLAGRFRGLTIFPSGGERGRFQISVKTPSDGFQVTWTNDLRAGLVAAMGGEEEDVFS